MSALYQVIYCATLFVAIGTIRLDSTYILTNPATNYQLPMYVFTLICSFNFVDKNNGDTLHLFGQDSANCAINMNFNIGDTMVVALGKEPTIFSSQAVHFIPFLGFRLWCSLPKNS